MWSRFEPIRRSEDQDYLRTHEKTMIVDGLSTCHVLETTLLREDKSDRVSF